MAGRKKYSKGGEVANGGDDDFEKLADSAPDNFDDLSLRDDLEFSYDGANSGDERGNEQQDEDRSEAVQRIMRQRKMSSNRNPRPA
jgi:hypothetical protein